MSQKKCFVICPNPSVDILASIGAIKAGASNRIQTEKKFPGGKGVHVALALAEMKIPVTLVGFWGKENGKWLQTACNTYQPDLEIIGVEVTGQNRSCYTFKSVPKWQDTEILGTGPILVEQHFEQLCKLLENRKSEIHSITVAGSWPQGALPHYNRTLTEWGQAADIPAFLDCTGGQLESALLAEPYFVHLNRSEVCTFYDADFATAKDKLRHSCKLAAVTDGSRGLYLFTPKEEVHALVKITKVKSTVGAGDCLTAGILAAHYQGKSIRDMAKWGAACGAANCLHEDLGMLRRTDAEQLFAIVSSTVSHF